MKVFCCALLVAVASAMFPTAKAGVDNNSTCGSESPSKVIDCGKTDLGSCGNACCTIELELAYSAEEAYTGTKMWLTSKGDDGSFTYVTGKDAAGHNPGDDLRQYNIPWQFIFQGTHSTKGGYVDTIDINIKNGTTAGTSIIRAFNIANIHGALGDNGQSYKTLKYMADALAPGSPVKILNGCGGAPAPSAPTPAPRKTVCKATEYCCPDAKKCLTPTTTSCATGAAACTGGEVCCPLTKICVTPGASCMSPCAGAFCCPDAKKCLTPADPGKIVSGAGDCVAPRIFCPLTKLCVYSEQNSCVPP